MWSGQVDAVRADKGIEVLLIGVVSIGPHAGLSLPLFATLISDLDEVPGNLKLHRAREAGRD